MGPIVSRLNVAMSRGYGWHAGRMAAGVTDAGVESGEWLASIFSVLF
jgi:hypothetical protein